MSSRLADVLRILEQALERDEGERQAYLESACGDDADLRREVEALLAERVRCGRPPARYSTLANSHARSRSAPGAVRGHARTWARAAWEPSTRRATRG